MRNRTISIFQWRAPLAGLIGGILGIFLIYLIHHKSAYAALYWFFFAAPYYLPAAVIVGSGMGAMTRLLTRGLRTNRVSGAIVGAISATFVGALIGLIVDLAVGHGSLQSVAESFLVRFGAIVGFVTGVSCGFQDNVPSAL